MDLITGEGADEGAEVTDNMNYCRVHLNHYNNIVTLTCLTNTVSVIGWFDSIVQAVIGVYRL